MKNPVFKSIVITLLIILNICTFILPSSSAEFLDLKEQTLIFDNPDDYSSLFSTLEPQTVTVLQHNDHGWYCIKTWLGNKWLKPGYIYSGATACVNPVSSANSILDLEKDRCTVAILSKNFGEDSIPYQNVLSSLGIKYTSYNIKNMQNIDWHSVKVLIVPESTATNLAMSLVNQIIKETENGMQIITEGHSKLAEKLGIMFLNQKSTLDSLVYTCHPEINIKWNKKLEVEEIARNSGEVLVASKDTQIPLVYGINKGNGKVLYLAVALDAPGSLGYSRFPYFHETLNDFLGVKPILMRDRLIVYMDWGYHYADDPRSLANCFKQYGISEVHLSSWYNLNNCGTFFTDFINACHANGILVYAWFELPMVSEDFWNQYPQWREKTGADKDAKLDWRYLMALEMPECMEAVKEVITDIVNTYDWDGIDLAELYFEQPYTGFEEPETFSPMCKYVRNTFQAQYDFDPILLFDQDSVYYWKNNNDAFKKFVDFRANLCTALNKEILEYLKGLKNHNNNQPLDIYLTQIDNIVDTRMRTNIGVDSEAFIKLEHDLGFNLQVEDPFLLWNEGPERYKTIGTAYRNKLPAGEKLTVDINIVNRFGEVFPTQKQTGLEFLALLCAASNYSDQVCLYAAQTPYENDYFYVPFALANQATINKITTNRFAINAPYTVKFSLDTSANEVFMNGIEWPCLGKNTVIIPPGENTLEIKPRTSSGNIPLYLTDISTEIISCRHSDGSIILKYNDKRNVYISLNKLPQKVYLNGNEIEPEIYSTYDGYTLQCPAGNNIIIFVP